MLVQATVGDLEAALEEFREIATDLGGEREFVPGILYCILP
jgi:hypothetical protein